MAVNILLADDHRMVREGLKQLLETDSEINVVAEAGDGYECLNLTNKTKPDIVLLDINMPNMDGIQVLNIMKQQKMLCKVIVLTIHNEIEYLVKALENVLSTGRDMIARITIATSTSTSEKPELFNFLFLLYNFISLSPNFLITQLV